MPESSEAKIYRFEGFTADPQTRRVTGPEGDIELTGAEFDLLKKSIARFQERQAEKTVSLNLEKRLASKAADKTFRDESEAARKALEASDAYAFTEYFVAPPPPPRIKAEKSSDDENADDADEEEANADERYAKMNVYLRESLRVLADLRGLAPVAPELAAAK